MADRTNMISPLALRCVGALVLTGQLISCSAKRTNPKKTATTTVDRLATKLDLYHDLSTAPDWPSDSRCDALLFASLWDIAFPDSKKTIPVMQAESRDEPGRWFRTATHDCYENGSDSDISGDMILGVLHYLWDTQDLAAIERLIAYGVAHEVKILGVGVWIMGRGPVGATKIMPQLQATIYEMRKALGGADHDVRRFTVVTFTENALGYEGHLQVLHLWLRAKALRGVTSKELGIMTAYADREPLNTLYQALAYRFSGESRFAERLEDVSLNMENLFPGTRLPTGADRCGHYLNERDAKSEPHNFVPCEKEKDRERVFSGTDFSLPVSIYLGRTKDI